MDEINEELISEIRILLVAEESEFRVERGIINELIYPTLKKFFSNEFNIEFNIIDVYQETNCNNLPEVNKSEFILSEIRKCQKLSMGLSSIIFIGDSNGNLAAPKSLTIDQFKYVLNFLQSKNDPAWIIFNTKYIENLKTNSYNLEDNISKEENLSILDSIARAIDSANDIFPETFVDCHFKSILERCISIATSKASSARVIHRLTLDSKDSKEVKIQDNGFLNNKTKQNFESMIKLITRKFVNENYLKYTVSKAALSDAEKDIKTDEKKLSKIFDMCTFSTNKCRNLTRDLRITSNSDNYMQIFTESIMKIIRESCCNIFTSKDFSKISSMYEIISHKSNAIALSVNELTDIINRNRERERNIFLNYLNSSSTKSPGLIFGPTGSGKSTLLLGLSKQIDPNTVVLIRHCAKTSSSSSLQLLLSSMTQQINLSFSKSEKNLQSSEYAVCVYEFWLSLNKATKLKPIFILLDDVDKLFPSSHTDMMKWLPHSLPNFVKILLTSSSNTFYNGFKHRYDETNIINLSMIDSREAIKLFNDAFKTDKCLPENVISQACFTLQENSSPLFLTLLFWSIDSLENPEILTSDTKSVVKINIKKLEKENNSVILMHVFAYLSLSRYGLSLSELVDLLSLDNRLCQSIQYDFSSGKGFKFPIYIVENLLENCKNLLEYTQTSNRLLIRFRHSVYVEVIKDYYNLFKEDGMYFYQNIYDYWTSKYENDKLKSILDNFSDNDESSQIYIKRNIMPQPYYTINKFRKVSSNERKLTELPFLLISFEKSNELYKLILFNFEYLFATLNHYGMNHLLCEIYFCREINDIKNNPEVELLLLQLRLLSKTVVNDAQLLAPELTGRLSHLIGSNSMLSYLHQNIDFIASKVNSIISLIPSYVTIDKENIHVEMGSKMDIILSALSLDNRFLTTIHLEKPTHSLIVMVWDSRTATKSQIINLGNFKDTNFSQVIYVPQKEDFLILKFENIKNRGFLIVNLEFSCIEKTINFPISSSVKVEYVSKSHLYLFINNETQIIYIPSGEKDNKLSQLPWPTILTPSDKYLIGQKPPAKKDISENNINFNLRVVNYMTEETVCQLSLNYGSSYLLANSRNETLFVATKFHGIIYKFEISQIAKKEAKKLKFHSQFKITEQEVSSDVKELITKYYPNIKGVKLQLSVDEKQLLGEYSLSDAIRIFAIWNVANKSVILCNQISHSATISFSTDGLYFWCYTKNESLQVFNLSNGTQYTLELNDVPNGIYMLKSGSFFMTFPSAVKLITLKTLIKQNKILENNSEYQLENFHISLPNPKISTENVVIFSNNETSSKLIYYNLTNNGISSLDLSHSNDSLTEFPCDRILSPNGEKLLLVYKFKLAETLNTRKDLSIEELMLKENKNGFLISTINDYRKPQIPRENYFLGNFNDSKENYVYGQKIAKIINLKTSETIFQVSLTGENILRLTDDILITFKPDYASLTRKNEDAFDIISIYNITDKKLVSSLFMEHAVVDSIIMPQEKDKLLVCCGKNGGIIKILGGEYYTKVFLEIDVQSILKYSDEFARSSRITKLFVFKENCNLILVQYFWLEHNSNTVKSDKETHYTKIDLLKKEIICQITSLGKLVDVSNDGSLAIDSLLNVYELHKGTIVRKLQSSMGWNNDISIHDCLCLFSNDASYIVVLDSISENLWVILNDDQGLANGRALLTPSVTNVRSSKPFQMCLVLDSQLLIVYNDLEFKLFVIKVNSKPINSEVIYKSTSDRIKKLLYSH